MADLIYDELRLFGICFLLGTGIVFLYDLFRIFRMLIPHKDIFVDLEDLLYWVLTAWLVFCTMFRFNEGKLRGYAFLGMFSGILIYTFTVRRLLLFVVRKLLPFWNKAINVFKRPFVSLVMYTRKALKNMIIEVKMAIKSR